MGLGDIGKRAVRAVWSGPFAVGPLVQPISLGSALLRILEVIWKAVIALVIAAGTTLMIGVVWESIDRALNPSLESQLKAEAHFDPASCSKEYPIVVIIRNQSKRALTSARIDLVVRQPGRSTNLNREPSFDWDAIVQPGNVNALCYPLPSDISEAPNTLEYSANVWLASSQD